MPSDPEEVGPQEIIEAIILNFRKTILPSRFVNYFNNEYVVLLNRSDFDRLTPFATSIREEAIKALDQELEDLSRKKGWLSKDQGRYTSNGPWQIHIILSENDEVRTERIVVDSKPSLTAESVPLDGPATLTVNRPQGSGLRETERTHFAPQQSAQTIVYATLTFEDSTGTRQVYEMRKDLIKVGRGGPPDIWVDLTVLSSTDVSREHFEIRRDSATGKFFIKDLSRFGTWINGKKIAASATANGVETYREVLEPLPAKAQINLANVLSIEFRAAKS